MTPVCIDSTKQSGVESQSATLACWSLLDPAVPHSCLEPCTSYRAQCAEDLSGEGFKYVHEFYTASPGSVTSAASVPVLWDRRTKRIVSNDSGNIMAMFATEFDAFVRCERRNDHATGR